MAHDESPLRRQRMIARPDAVHRLDSAKFRVNWTTHFGLWGCMQF